MCLLFVSFLFRASISDLALIMCCGVKIRLQFKTSELKNKKPFTKKKLIFLGECRGRGNLLKTPRNLRLTSVIQGHPAYRVKQHD